ncbi:hypothetical protein P3X46_002762 [Hevea brasiliensis]|uniref:Uncharacterized protein n=1 Tax=Hevea brasiliensis TaxID=3981 RepID=A0ABQ9N505_HEVBR|nr:uncharacterized protein LOC110648642 [Hevea brasiliensis]XP_021658628.2 uncharacterized protein LOC110648642 [Hevea brasiliensis]KAJ9187289.1 hypothetical protein P3X46_002762 [Hevea brasiliensis]
MNSCGYQRKSAMGGCEERRMMEADSVVCPKPRRLGLSIPSLHDQFRPLRLSISHQTDMGDSIAGPELLDIILTKGGCGGERSGYQVALSPPFYCGSPPSRASNPVVQDAQFGNEKINPFSPAPLSPSSSSARKGGGCVRMKFGHKPAAVRIEGFDCLSRDRRNCSISAVA